LYAKLIIFEIFESNVIIIYKVSLQSLSRLVLWIIQILIFNSTSIFILKRFLLLSLKISIKKLLLWLCLFILYIYLIYTNNFAFILRIVLINKRFNQLIFLFFYKFLVFCFYMLNHKIISLKNFVAIQAWPFFLIIKRYFLTLN